MADLYGNPYLPSFVRNQPKMADPALNMPQTVLPTRATQINTAQGFAGARQYAMNLTNGSSEIIAEADPNIARVYVIAVDQNGQRYVRGFRLIEEEEPKPITMDDLNLKMNEVLERLNHLEEEKVTANGQSNHRNAWANKPVSKHIAADDRNAANGKRSGGGTEPNGNVEPGDAESP